MRPPFNYIGSKEWMADIIAQYMPANMETFVDGFFGSGGLFFSRYRWAECEIINDLNGDVINFFRVLRDKPKRLIEALQLTPHSRIETRESGKIMSATRNEIKRALYFFVRANQSFAASTRGWRMPTANKNIAGEWRNKTDPVTLYRIAERLTRASIECNPAIQLIKQYRNKQTFFYLDPPYLNVQWEGSAKYNGYSMKEADHQELIEAVLCSPSMFIISGYDHPLYNQLTDQGYRKIQVPAQVGAINQTQRRKNADINTARTEILWISPNIQSLQNALF